MVDENALYSTSQIAPSDTASRCARTGAGLDVSTSPASTATAPITAAHDHFIGPPRCLAASVRGSRRRALYCDPARRPSTQELSRPDRGPDNACGKIAPPGTAPWSLRRPPRGVRGDYHCG